MSGTRVFGGLLLVLAGAAMGGGAAWFMKEPERVVRVEREVVTVEKQVPSVAAPGMPTPAPTPAVAPEEPAVVKPAADPLASYFNEWVKSPELAGASVGFCVLDEKGGSLFASPLAETALCPASALKTLTTATALELLGPDFRFRTVLLAGGGISREGRVAGDLVLKGSGDPTLSEEDLVALVEEAVAKGLKRVDGALKVDASVFSAAPVSDHWVWGDLGNAYGAGAFGVNVGHNVFTMAFDPGGKEGDPAKFLGADPSVKSTRWEVAVKTGPAGSGDRVMIYSSPFSQVVSAGGTVPLGERGFVVRGAVPDPPLLARTILQAAFAKRGVIFGAGKAGEAEGIPVASHESPPLPEIIDHLHETSDNLEAQCLFLTLGNLAAENPADAVKQHWEKRGVAFTGLRLVDGSGLARATMIRPVDLARVNLMARQGPQGERFLQSLPSSYGGKLRAKRGAMSGVRTEVGFVIRDGREYAFALMANGLGPDVDFWKLRATLLGKLGP